MVEKPFLEHDNAVFFNVPHFDAFEKLFLTRTQLPDVREHLCVQKIFVTIERIVDSLEGFMVETMNTNPVIN